MRVLHFITRLIVGGAQENTILNCHDLISQFSDEVLLATGPGLGPEGSLEADARSRGIPLEILPSLRRAIHPARDWRAFRDFDRIIRRWRPDVVHTHSGKAGLFGRVAADRCHVPAIVHTVHGAPFHEYQAAPARQFFRQCERFATGHCHAVISVADAMTDRLVAAGVAPREKFTTIYSGMEIEPFLRAEQHREKVRRQLGFAADDIVVGKIGRFFHLKGHSDFIDAAAKARRKCQQLRFLLVGEGILRDQFQREVAQAGIRDDVCFAGLVNPKEIPGYLAATDLVVHTSLREGLARVLPQALIAGRPVISYDIDGAREVVRDGETGYLVAPGDVARVARCMVELAANPTQRETLSATGRELCRVRFDHRQMTDRIRKLYEEVLEANALSQISSGK